MTLVKRLLLFILCGAVLGNAIATVFTPGYLAWDNTPGQGQALCNCTEVTKNTATSLIRAQLLGTGIGAGVFLILGLFLAGRRKPQRPEPVVTAPTPAPEP
jgi:hypothetical protein